MASRHRVVDHIVEYLAASGVDYIFGVDGANIEDLYDAAFFRDDITAVLAKHEFSAATMADGYSRSGAGLGVVAATSGGGCLNTVPGLGEAFASRVPVLALIGQPPTTLDGRGSFQDTSGRNGALDARGAVLRGFGVLPAGDRHRKTSSRRCPRRSRRPAPAGPQCCCCPRTFSRLRLGVNGGRRRFEPIGTQLGDPTGDRVARCGMSTGRSRSSPVNRSPATTRAANSSNCGRCCAPGWPCVPDAKDVAGTPGMGSSSALGVTGVMGHPGVAPPSPAVRCACWSAPG